MTSLQKPKEKQGVDGAASAIPRRKLFDHVLSRLTDQISAGEFAPGEHLPPERDLINTYGVRRPAVREALQSLQCAGIILISHGVRARVAVPTAGMLINQIASGARHPLSMNPELNRHLKDARLFLETGLARQAAAQSRENGRETLDRCHAAHVGACDDVDAFARHDMAFHREIAHITGNPIYPAVIEAMFGWLREYYAHLVRTPGAESLTLDEHERIPSAIRDGNQDEAARAMHDHHSRANSLYSYLAQGGHEKEADE